MIILGGAILGNYHNYSWLWDPFDDKTALK